ncbi:MAG: hypothetical protein ACRCXZ_06080 [Patescibacteria group bacterium]
MTKAYSYVIIDELIPYSDTKLTGVSMKGLVIALTAMGTILFVGGYSYSVANNDNVILPEEVAISLGAVTISTLLTSTLANGIANSPN